MLEVLHNQIVLAAAGGAVVILALGAVVAFRFRPKGLDAAKFQPRWLDIQRLCGKSETWPLAIINADKLLDDALKQLHMKGRTMGERLVTAQRRLSNNDGAWYGHKLRNKLVHEEVPKLNRKDVQLALQGFRQALKDLGALK